MRIVIGNDHVAYSMKCEIKEYLAGKGYQIIDIGTHNEERTDYPYYGKAAAEMIVRQEADLGILICGTGVGISLTANKIRGIRAVVCSEPYTARLSRQHNDTNILAFGSRVIGIELAKMIVDEWLNAVFEGGRHKARLDMITVIEEGR